MILPHSDNPNMFVLLFLYPVPMLYLTVLHIPLTECYSPLTFSSWFALLIPDLFACLSKHIGYIETDQDWEHFEGAKDRQIRMVAAEADIESLKPLQKRGETKAAMSRTVSFNKAVQDPSPTRTRADSEGGMYTLPDDISERSFGLNASASFSMSKPLFLDSEVSSDAGLNSGRGSAPMSRTNSSSRLLSPRKSTKEQLNSLLPTPRSPMRRTDSNGSISEFSPRHLHTPMRSSGGASGGAFSPIVPTTPAFLSKEKEYTKSMHRLLAEGNFHLINGSVYCIYRIIKLLICCYILLGSETEHGR